MKLLTSLLVLAIIQLAVCDSESKEKKCPANSHPVRNAEDCDDSTCNNLTWKRGEKCRSRCACDEGFIKTNGRCIRYYLCRNIGSCGLHSEFKSCIKCGHQQTCQNYGKPSPKCDGRCKAGCRCLKGYVLDEERKRCVKPENCKCPRNSSFDDCAKRKNCTPGCKCNKGFQLKGKECERKRN